MHRRYLDTRSCTHSLHLIDNCLFTGVSIRTVFVCRTVSRFDILGKRKSLDLMSQFCLSIHFLHRSKVLCGEVTIFNRNAFHARVLGDMLSLHTASSSFFFFYFFYFFFSGTDILLHCLDICSYFSQKKQTFLS